jgi:outer membrane protein OmpA-like peptidoglycan-associated protein
MHRLTHKISLLAMAAASALTLSACAAATAPQQLIDARAAYRHATASPAARNAPTHLETARRALVRAEQSFDNDPRSEETKDLAYIAQRLAQLAEVQSDTVIAENDKRAAEREMQVVQQRKAHETEEKLSETQQELSKVETSREDEARRNEIEKQRTKLDETKKDLERARQARRDAQRAAREAREAMEKFANVKDEARGTVITIPGSLLFTSGKSTLIPGAPEKLDTVVDALREYQDRRVTIEGYSDSTGRPSVNLRLSEKRAQAVKDYLVRHGIEPDRIITRGMGSENPVDSNSTPEGRANNRRVEIILENVSA